MSLYRILGWLVLFGMTNIARAQTEIFVSSKGNDQNAGTITAPVRTLRAAISKALTNDGKKVIINLREGTYHPDSTIVIDTEDYRLKSLNIRAYKNETVVVSAAFPLNLQWQPYRNGILQAKTNLDKSPDRLIMPGANLHMARFPNYDAKARVFNGTSSEALSRDRTGRWKDPAGGYVHALHQGEWGGFHYLIKGRNDTALVLEGGWQNNRPAPMHDQYRFVENIFEELDAPNEWYFDKNSKTLFLHPPSNFNKRSIIYASRLNEIIVLRGNTDRPLKNIRIENINFTGTNRTFMKTKEPLLRSDWTIYRGAAVLLDGTENVAINKCTFYDLGGNAIFISNYNKGNVVSNNHIHHIGANAISFVGDTGAVRSPSFRYEQFVPWHEMDYAKGPKTNNYPLHCTATGNLIHHIGFVEKQVAGVQISTSSNITVSHNTIYDVPRAGINIGDGCWGGHVLEYNDVFNTVLETGDHGAFNSWGRDRFWRPERHITDSFVKQKPGIELLDVVQPIVIRNNRFHCEHGWDIDLDDGSSNYQIYNNVCLNGGLKLREGYQRHVYNNIILNNTFHPHVWYKESRDRFTRNIVSISYAPILMEHWGAAVDSNFFVSEKGLQQANELGLDSNGASGEPGYVNVAGNDFRVQNGSPVFAIGFVNFPMKFGVTDSVLIRMARKAPTPELMSEKVFTKGTMTVWLGSKLKNIETLGERSAAGLPDNNGVLVAEVAPGSASHRSGLQAGDVIVKLDEKVNSVKEFMDVTQKMKWMGSIEATIIRNQQQQKIRLVLKEK